MLGKGLVVASNLVTPEVKDLRDDFKRYTLE
jgi:hypothetical protein